MNIEKNVMYNASIENVAFGNIPKEHLIKILSSGRMCGVLLESDIASRFDGVVEGTQGNAPDFIDDVLGTVQAKTYRLDQCQGTIAHGARKGLSKSADKKIFTTKSGLWDSLKRRVALGEDVNGQIVEYFDKYDCFCYIDISRMCDLEYSFIIVDTSVPKSTHVDGRISLDDILANVEKTIDL